MEASKDRLFEWNTCSLCKLPFDINIIDLIEAHSCVSWINMRFNEQYCSFTHGGGESRTFRPRGLCQLLTFCKQLTKTSGSKRPALAVLLSPSCSHRPALTSPVCKAEVLLVKSHVDKYHCFYDSTLVHTYTPTVKGGVHEICRK